LRLALKKAEAQCCVCVSNQARYHLNLTVGARARHIQHLRRARCVRDERASGCYSRGKSIRESDPIAIASPGIAKAPPCTFAHNPQNKNTHSLSLNPPCRLCRSHLNVSRSHCNRGRDGRTARRHHTGISLEGRCDALAVAHPWASASSYLPSQSLADSRCNLHATSRSSHSRRSLPCRAQITVRVVISRGSCTDSREGRDSHDSQKPGATFMRSQLAER